MPPTQRVADELEVAHGAAGHEALDDQRAHAVDDGELLEIDPRRSAAREHHLVEVTREAEAGDVRHRVRARTARIACRRTVEAAHAGDGVVEASRPSRPPGRVASRFEPLVRGGDDAGAERLRQDEHVADVRGSVRQWFEPGRPVRR